MVDNILVTVMAVMMTVAAVFGFWLDSSNK